MVMNGLEGLGIGLILIPMLSTYILSPFYIRWQRKRGKTEINYEGREVVNGGGFIVLLALLALAPFIAIFESSFLFYWLLLICYFSGFAFLGALDDFWGEKQPKGFGGHLKILWKEKKISTGLYKAGGGLILAFALSAVSGAVIGLDWLVKGLFLALCSNFFNLMDTRPARAGKLFYLFSFMLLLWSREHLFFILPLWSALYIYLFWELNKKIMLGDTGAYLLGAAVGFYSIFLLSLELIYLSTLFLLLMHWLCEKFSLSAIMENKRYLCYTGKWGRRS